MSGMFRDLGDTFWRCEWSSSTVCIWAWIETGKYICNIFLNTEGGSFEQYELVLFMLLIVAELVKRC